MKTLYHLGISPAPWSVTPNKFGSYDVTAKDSTLVVAYDPPFEEPKDSRNKRLIAAAPELYEALSGLLEIVCVDCNSSYKVDGKCVKCPRVVAAEAALAKAGGGE